MNKEKTNKNTEISARIAEILQYTGETRNCFATKLGYERAQTVYDILNMKSAPSYDFFRRFSISEYSEIIELKWLLSGEGSMLRSNDDEQPSESAQQPEYKQPANEQIQIVKRFMDKIDEKDAKIDQLQTELRLITKELAAIKVKYSQSQAKEPDSPTAASLVTEAFTSESSGGYGEDSKSTKLPSGSKRLSAGKI